MSTGYQICPTHDTYFSICGCSFNGISTAATPLPKPFEFVSEIPKEAGDLVATCEYQGRLIVACQYAIFRLEGDTLVQIKFKK